MEPTDDLVAMIASAVDKWHKTHPDLTVGDVLDALETVQSVLAEATARVNEEATR